MRRNLIRSCCGTSSCCPRWLAFSHRLHHLLFLLARLYVCNAPLCAVCPPPKVTRVDGDKILPYRSDLVQILQLTLHLKCKQGYTLACNLLHHILRSLALIYPTEYCSVPGGFHQPISDYLPIKVKTLVKPSATDTAVKLPCCCFKSLRIDGSHKDGGVILDAALLWSLWPHSINCLLSLFR